MDNQIYVPRLGTLKGTLFIIAVAVAFTVGLSLASPAHGAGVKQDSQGDISGTVTLNNAGAAGVTVELRKRSNGRHKRSNRRRRLSGGRISSSSLVTTLARPISAPIRSG